MLFIPRIMIYQKTSVTQITAQFHKFRVIYIRRLGWAGHVVRMEEERIAKKGFKRKLLHHKTNGKTKSQKADVVQRDALQLLGIRGWKRRAENRDEWRRLMREVKARKGL